MKSHVETPDVGICQAGHVRAADCRTFAWDYGWVVGESDSVSPVVVEYGRVHLQFVTLVDCVCWAG